MAYGIAGERFNVPGGIYPATVLPDMDFETYSEAGYYYDTDEDRYKSIVRTAPHGIGAVGASAYTEHDSAEVLSLFYDLKNGQGRKFWAPWLPNPTALFEHLDAGGLIEAHNSLFEFFVWNNICARRYGWPPLRLESLRCSMSKCRAHGIPGKLEKAGEILGLTPDKLKSKRGQQILEKVSKPRTRQIKKKDPTPRDLRYRLTAGEDPEVFKELYDYNAQDIVAEAAVSIRTPDLTPSELELWQLDQKINVRGVHIDRAALNACISIVRQAEQKYTNELIALTAGVVKTADEHANIKAFLAARGVHTGSVDKDHVIALLSRDDLPADCRRVLELRKSLSAKSVTKLFAIDRRLSKDGRLRDLFMYYGADRTGRFTGVGPQPQNLKSGGPEWIICYSCGAAHATALPTCGACGAAGGRADDTPYEWGVGGAQAALDDIATGDLARVESLWGDAFGVVSSCLRALFTAAPGHDLICSDFSAIEAVVAAVIAREQWRIDVFKTHGKIYEQTMSDITGVPFAEIIEYKKRTGQHHPKRKPFGKIPELASCYAGWINAWHQFGANEFMDDDNIKKAILAWRKKSPRIVEMWGGQWRKNPNAWDWWPELYGLEGVVIKAIQNPGKYYDYNGIIYAIKDGNLFCHLPSGRNLVYHKVGLAETTHPAGMAQYQITYWGWNTDYKKGPRGWMQFDTYGGKLFENIVQAIARDLLAFAMKNIEAAGYSIVLHVHDEIVSEVIKGAGSIADFERIMQTLPEWAKDWPIKAAGGWRGLRYRKE